MSKQKQCCGTCKFGEFTLQKNGRINRNRAGECLFKPFMPPLPISITKAFGFRSEFGKSAIWYEYTDCPVYDPRKGGES